MSYWSASQVRLSAVVFVHRPHLTGAKGGAYETFQACGFELQLQDSQDSSVVEMANKILTPWSSTTAVFGDPNIKDV